MVCVCVCDMRVFVHMPCMQGFQSADKEVLDRCAKDSWSSGACAVVAWLLGNILVLGNVGDSKGVLARITDKVGYHVI